MGRNWIKIETVTCDKPEVCVVATQLKMDPDMVVGKLVRLWSWAEVNRINGNEMSVTFEFIDKVVGKKGFAAALAKAGWLREVGDKLQFPNFGRHNGPSGKGRALTAQRVSRHRERKRNDSETVAENEQASDGKVSREGGTRTKPRNERRNTVKELIESALEDENTINSEVGISSERSGLEEGAAFHTPTLEADAGAEKSLEESVLSQEALDQSGYEDVTIHSSIDDEFDVEDQMDSLPAVGEERAALENVSSSSIEGVSMDPGTASGELDEAESAGLPTQKGKKARGGVGPARKVIVPETPDQPLLF